MWPSLEPLIRGGQMEEISGCTSNTQRCLVWSLTSTSSCLRTGLPEQCPVDVSNTALNHPTAWIQERLQVLCYESGLNKGQECHSLPGKHRQFVFTVSSDSISMRKLVWQRFIYFNWMWDTFQSATLTAWESVVLHLPWKGGQERKHSYRLDLLCPPSLMRSYLLGRCSSR